MPRKRGAARGSGGSGGRGGSGTAGGGHGGGHGAAAAAADGVGSSVGVLGPQAPGTEALSTALEATQYESETAGDDAAEQEEGERGQQDEEGAHGKQGESLKLKEPLDPRQFGDASPVKASAKRSSTPRSPVWALVKRLKDEQLKGEKAPGAQTTPWTHVCIRCWRLLRMTWHADKEVWLTSNALAHVRKFACDQNLAADHEERASKKQMSMMKQMHAASLVMPVAFGFSINPTQQALSTAAAWYIYSNQRISKRTFEDEPFRNMLQKYYSLGGGKGTAPFLTIKGLSKYVNGEFECFLQYARFACDEMIKFTEGNPFCQNLHDCATLENHLKCMAGGAEFVDAKTFEQHVICLGMRPVDGGLGRQLQQSLDQLFQRAFGRKTKDVCHSMIADRAETHVAALFSLDRDVCEMHDVDKVAKSAIGDLVRSHNKKATNPFPEGQRLINAVHNMAKWFAVGSRHQGLVKAARAVRSLCICLCVCSLVCMCWLIDCVNAEFQQRRVHGSQDAGGQEWHQSCRSVGSVVFCLASTPGAEGLFSGFRRRRWISSNFK